MYVPMNLLIVTFSSRDIAILVLANQINLRSLGYSKLNEVEAQSMV